jgi:hemerythrin-like domain-containing protein
VPYPEHRAKAIFMNPISQFLTAEHHHCDTLFASAESAVAEGAWGVARSLVEDFLHATAAHFEREERVLFPAFEDATGMVMGPTQVMRAEHNQMREVFDELRAAAAKGDADLFLGLSETLLMLMQQHNLKEEQMLYRMADTALDAQSDAVMDDMRAIAVAA